MQVKENRQLTKDVYALKLVGDFPYHEVQAGQFVDIKIGAGLEFPLRRPLSIAHCDVKKQELTLIYRVVGGGTTWLRHRDVGDSVDVLGPLGTGFPLPKPQSSVLVVGGGVGIPPLYQLVREFDSSIQPQIILGFRDKFDCFWIEEFAEYGKVTVCTEDGSKGHKGLVTTALGAENKWDYLYSCGPKPMLRALKGHFEGTTIQGYVSLEERMACGIGACSGCTCLTSDGKGTKRVCKDGPVFPWEEVVL
ncbi:MAG: dihydroorotate dehydrogenase electron transfer subunit [Firmicutes bacterium]|nr:dihydroorotate dehydrogenase electron transfer subunit [Bacillota bacterium]